MKRRAVAHSKGIANGNNIKKSFKFLRSQMRRENFQKLLFTSFLQEKKSKCLILEVKIRELKKSI